MFVKNNTKTTTWYMIINWTIMADATHLTNALRIISRNCHFSPKYWTQETSPIMKHIMDLIFLIIFIHTSCNRNNHMKHPTIIIFPNSLEVSHQCISWNTYYKRDRERDPHLQHVLYCQETFYCGKSCKTKQRQRLKKLV